MERFTFTVGKLDAGMAILIGERAHLIEFPSILLPPGVTSGSIVNISVNQNHRAESAHLSDFWALQDSILTEYGLASPSAPELRLRHVTQTSVTLEWPTLNLAKAKLRSLEIYKNGQRLALIPNAGSNTSTKLSSLQSNEEYTFQLVLKTTAGTYPSNIIRVRTHTMTDTSGISVCFGQIDDSTLLSHAKQALDHMNAKWTDRIQIDTTHFVCTGPGRVVVEDEDEDGEDGRRGEFEEGGGGRRGNGRGASGLASPEYQKAVQMSLPIVQPHWVLACHQDKKLVAVSSFQLGATAPIQYVNSARFSRGESSKPGSPIRRDSMNAAAQAASIARAPSPETIARMSVDPAPHRESESRNQSQRSSGSRSTPTSPTLEAPSHRFGEPRSIGQVAEVYQEPSHSYATNGINRTQTPPPPSPRSPKPEADGKLDRAFKFPTSDSRPGTPTLPPAGAAVAGSQAAAAALNRGKQEEGELPAPLPEGPGQGAAVLEPEAEQAGGDDAVPSESIPTDSAVEVEAESAVVDDLIQGGEGPDPVVDATGDESAKPEIQPSLSSDVPKSDAVATAASGTETASSGAVDQIVDTDEDLVANGSTMMAEFIKGSSSGISPSDAKAEKAEEGSSSQETPAGGSPKAETDDAHSPTTSGGIADSVIKAIVQGSELAKPTESEAKVPVVTKSSIQGDDQPEGTAPSEVVAELEEVIAADEGGIGEGEDEVENEAEMSGTDTPGPMTSASTEEQVSSSEAKKSKKKKGGKGKKK